MTDLAVSLLTLSETKAKAAEARTEHYLDELAPLRPQADRGDPRRGGANTGTSPPRLSRPIPTTSG